VASALAPGEVIALWLKAGGPLSTAPMALARAYSESSLRPDAKSANPDGGTNIGIYQLDTRGVGAGHSAADLSDPLKNTEITVKATNGGRDWKDWADNYQEFLPQARGDVTTFTDESKRATGGLGGYVDKILRNIGTSLGGLTGLGGPVSAVGSTLKLPGDVTGFFGQAEQFLQAAVWITNPASWARILAGLAGLVLGLLGIVALARAA
jgi:hypothetical protein